MRAAGAALAAGLAGWTLLRRLPALQATRVLRISRSVADLDRAEAFYQEALGFHAIGRKPLDPAVLAALGLADRKAEEAVMRLGADEVSLVRFTPSGRAYPAGSRSDDLWFQHLAIIVGDMDAAFARLQAHAGWQPVSIGGPQTLPPTNGGVRAFKFRDPDGHPLELLWFPPGEGRAIWHRGPPGEVSLGIDHTALAVASSRRAVRFYRRLGFRVADRSRNVGLAQSRLDGLSAARVGVTGLRPQSPHGPGVELLAYRPPGRAAAGVHAADIAADWTTVAVLPGTGTPPRCVRDPDGHRMLVVGYGAGPSGRPA